ncbi:MAG: DNA polymerase II large subunit, partial [Candidatus Methanomethylophilaceae archaeon]
GEVLVPFGEFCENNHFLIPCGYPIEWHKQELLRKGDLPKDWRDPTWERAKQMSRELGVPLHPNFNLFWSDMDVGSLDRLRMQILKNGTFIDSELHLLKDETSKKTLEDLGVLHTVQNDTLVIRRYALPLIEGLGLTVEGEKLLSVTEFSGESALEAVSRAMGLKVYARASTRIGMRMARPEKAKDRKGAPVIHGLFPVSDNPKYKKEVITAIHTIKQSPSYPTTHKVNVSVEAGKRVCPKCKKETYRAWCRDCCVHTEFITAGSGFERNNEIVELNDEYQAAMKTLELNSVPEVKVVDRLISKIKVPEALEKAILRAKYDLGTYKDGTIRFDMTDIPITHFRPREIELTVEKAIALGYTHDMDGNPLTSDEQLCELKVQDIIPNSGCGDYLVIVAAYVDHLLEKFYECDRFYNIENRQELIGHLGVGLAPHTSGGILCRIIGYTSANGCYAHPFFHAAKRRNCDGDEDSVILLLDCLINFSRAYLPDRRGGLMDAPLVLTTRLDPNEIDKEAHNIDCLREYPLEFYEAAMSFKDTKEIEKSMDLIAGRIGTPQQYEGLGFTHDTADISEGPKHSAYTTLETMMDKMEAQLYLGKKIRAVDEKDVATRVINKHFLPDMAGNLRSFSTQGVRCNVCGAKYRRIPLTGKCTAPNASKPGGRCNNPLVLSVYEASVKKYLAISQEIGRKYELSDYTKERIDILEMSMDSLFNNDKVKKCKLSDFF